MHSQRIYISSAPRSGSMWAYNATRELIRVAGKTVKPSEPPIDEEPLLNEAMTSPVKENEVWCVKTHRKLRPNIPGILIIVTYRDVRDCLASYMRFMNCDFQHALKMAHIWMNLTDGYFNTPTNNLLKVHYDSIIEQPAETIRRIDEFIGTGIHPDQMTVISEELKPDNLKNKIASLHSNRENLTEEDANKTLVVQLKNGSTRLYDKSTGFQSGHIGTIYGGLWKEMLDPDQQAQLLEETSSWLKRYGFKE